MNKSDIKKQLESKGIEIVKGNYVRKGDIKKLIAKIHEDDDILSSLTFKNLLLSVQNDSSAYEVRNDKNALKKAIMTIYKNILRDLEDDAMHVLNENMDFVINYILDAWE